MNNPVLEYIKQNKQDAVIFKATRLYKMAGDDEFTRGLIIVPICQMLSQLDNELMLESYIKSISKILGVKPTIITNELKKETKKLEEEKVQYLKENENALPGWIDKEHYYNWTFVQRLEPGNTEQTGVYFSAGENKPKRLTNFTMNAIAHIQMEGENNRRLAEISNGIKTAVIEVQNRMWASPEGFENVLLEKGVFHLEDGFTKSNLNRLKSYFLPQFKPCYELENLGWQPEGFFAYANLVYKDGVIKYDEYGIADIDGTNYLSMGASKILEGLRKNKSVYQNDNFLKYVETDLTFQEWTEYMIDVYLEKGMMGVCFAIMACYKDLIFARNNNCPIPYAFGPAQSGKSKFGESVAALFTLNMPALNLNQTTEYALWERLGRFSNVPLLFNEFDEKSIKEEFTRAFKGAFDGEGRNRGSGRKNKAETQQVNCLPFLLGQYLTTSDDGAVLQRTLPVKFVENNSRNDFQIRRFEELKRYEKEGITSLSCELMKHRQYVSDNYGSKYAEISKKMKDSLAKENLTPKNRILENYVNALTVTLLIRDKIKMSFTEGDFFEYCKQQIITLSSIISESNALSGFWSVVSFMLEQDIIEYGYDFKIEVKHEVTIAEDRKTNTKKTFTEPKKMLFLRFSSVHMLYLKEMQKINKRPLDDQTIIQYMKDQDSYIGNSPSGLFKSKKRKSINTSSYVFDYDLLKVNLERIDTTDNSNITSITGKLTGDAKAISVIDVTKLSFTLLSYETFLENEISVEKKLFTRCFFKDMQSMENLKIHTAVRVTGSLDIRPGSEGDFRTMEVHALEYTKPETTMPF